MFNATLCSMREDIKNYYCLKMSYPKKVNENVNKSMLINHKKLTKFEAKFNLNVCLEMISSHYTK